MPRKTSFLAKQRKEIQGRLAELRPHYEEYMHLEKLETTLEDLVEDLGTAVRRVTHGRPGRPRKATTARRRPGRPRKAAAAKRGPGRPRKAAATKGRAARPRKTTAARSAAGGRRRGATRADQTLKLISANPGITVSEIAKQLKVRQNYLYRVVNSLQSQGSVRRRGRGLHPA